MAKQANMITELLMLNAGLAPVDVDNGEDPIACIKKMMSMLSEADRRVAARKFRKQWRKAYRRDGIDIEQGQKPSSSEMRRRIWLVWQMFTDDQKTSSD
tara:strand:+ start:224 stop:520 length:297 start_codon:yes stop_codon:yes gene_type:complete